MPVKDMRLVVFDQNGAGKQKIAGVREYGQSIIIEQIIDISAKLPPVIDRPEDYLPIEFSGDLVLDFLKHPDLSDYLAGICQEVARAEH